MPHVDKHSNVTVKKHEGVPSSGINRKRPRESDEESSSETSENATSEDESGASEGAEGPRMSQWVDDEENEDDEDLEVSEPVRLVLFTLKVQLASDWFTSGSDQTRLIHDLISVKTSFLCNYNARSCFSFVWRPVKGETRLGKASDR
jgi:hypothetical protein